MKENFKSCHRRNILDILILPELNQGLGKLILKIPLPKFYKSEIYEQALVQCPTQAQLCASTPYVSTAAREMTNDNESNRQETMDSLRCTYFLALN